MRERSEAPRLASCSDFHGIDRHEFDPTAALCSSRCCLGCGLFVVIPNMQFFVAVAHTTWTMLIIQMVEAIALCGLAACIFEIAYRPKDYNQDSAATTSASVPVSSVG